MIAIKKINLKLFNNLINRNDICPNFQDENGNTILHHAVIIKDEDFQNSIINNPKVNINIQNKQLNTALHLAIKEKNESFAIKLIKNENINLNLKNINGKIPLNLAIETEQNNIINLICNNIKGDKIVSNNLLHSACQKNNSNLFIELIKKGFDYNEKDI